MAIRDPQELLHLLGLGTPEGLSISDSTGFALRVPREYVARMKIGNPTDPLLRQVLPLTEENRRVPGFSSDPLRERFAMASPGVLHKYRGRALLTLTGACAIHCRYCFRRHYPYSDANPTASEWRETLRWLKENSGIRELILSGGDPLSLSDERLVSFLAECETIGHLETIRFHTRLPVVIPQRVTQTLLDWIGSTRFNVVVVLHINHANELDSRTSDAFARLRNSGALLLNQSVLLRGVNDSSIALQALSESLLRNGVLPYYLHQLDRVAGAAHFEVDDGLAIKLVRELTSSLPGYLVPRLVREDPDADAKVPIELNPE